MDLDSITVEAYEAVKATLPETDEAPPPPGLQDRLER